MALVYEETGKPNHAEKAFEDLLEDMEAKWGLDNQQTLDLREEFAQLLDKHGKPEEAAQQRSRRQRRLSFDSLFSLSLWSSRSPSPSQDSKSGGPNRKPDHFSTSSQIDDTEEVLQKLFEEFTKMIDVER
jgi:hypothetical protein